MENVIASKLDDILWEVRTLRSEVEKQGVALASHTRMTEARTNQLRVEIEDAKLSTRTGTDSLKAAFRTIEATIHGLAERMEEQDQTLALSRKKRRLCLDFPYYGVPNRQVLAGGMGPDAVAAGRPGPHSQHSSTARAIRQSYLAQRLTKHGVIMQYNSSNGTRPLFLTSSKTELDERFNFRAPTNIDYAVDLNAEGGWVGLYYSLREIPGSPSDRKYSLLNRWRMRGWPKSVFLPVMTWTYCKSRYTLRVVHRRISEMGRIRQPKASVKKSHSLQLPRQGCVPSLLKMALRT